MSPASHSVAILFLVVCCLLNLLIPVAETSIQGQDRIIEKQSFSKEPVKIRVIKTKKREIELGENFTDGEDWLKGLTLNIENTSGKAITFISVLLLFPRAKDDRAALEPPFGESLKYGVSPFAPVGSVKPTQVQPVSAGDSIKKIVLSIEDIGFIDGTAWSAGQLWRRDSVNPENNGISEATELHSLTELGIADIDLNYKESKRTDQYGNQFRYRAKIRDVNGAQAARWACDVFLLSLP